jgi:hypothetical protein
MTLNDRLQIVQNHLEKEKGKREIISNNLEDFKFKLKQNKIRLKNIQEGQLILQHVAKQTQEELKYYLSDIVSVALNAVFDNPYEFEIEFVIKRGTTEAEIFFVRNKEKYKPIDASGFGPIDVAAFALRLAVLQLGKKYRRTIILDEPFKHLKGIEENKRVIQMVKELSDKLNLQIIMISDERVSLSEIEKGADKIFNIVIKKGITKIEEV